MEKRWGRRSAGLQRVWMLYSHLPEKKNERGKGKKKKRNKKEKKNEEEEYSLYTLRWLNP